MRGRWWQLAMTTSHIDINFNQEHPTNSEIEEMLNSLEITPYHSPDTRIDEFCRVIKSKYTNGGILFYQFLINGNKTFNFYATRNRLSEIDFINLVFSTYNFRTTAKELTEIQEIKKEYSNWATDIFTLPGELARLIFYGGAYSEPDPFPDKAIRLSTDFINAISNGRYGEFNSWNLGGEWSNWFYNIAWDYSIFLFDKRESIVSLVCLTDTD